MILITRPLAQTDELQALFNQAKLDFAFFPAFEIKNITIKSPIKSYDMAIFISVNAVIYASDYLQTITNNTKKIFAIGPATASMLAKYNITVDAYVKYNPSSESLLELVKYREIKDKKILIIRGIGGLEILKTKLQKYNIVDYLEVYDRMMLNVTKLHQESIKKFFNAKKAIITINSKQTLLNVLAIIKAINPAYIIDFKNYPIVVVSDRIAQYATTLGFKKVYINIDIKDIEFFRKLI